MAKLKTLDTEPDLMRQLAVHPDTFDPTCPHTLVIAPCCGVRTAADAVLDLRGIETPLRVRNVGPHVDPDFACTDCVWLMLVDPTNGWTRARLYAALGLDDAQLRHHVAGELADEERVAVHAAGGGHDDLACYTKHFAALAGQDMRAHPRTQRPAPPRVSAPPLPIADAIARRAPQILHAQHVGRLSPQTTASSVVAPMK